EAGGGAEGPLRQERFVTIDYLPDHAPHPFFGVVDDCLTIGGRSLIQLAAEVGTTPFYAYSRDHIRERIRTLRDRLPADVDLHYAIKANPMPAVVQFAAQFVDGLDVASAGELRKALDTGIDPAAVSFAGPGKTPAELERAVAAGVVVNVESPLE